MTMNIINYILQQTKLSRKELANKIGVGEKAIGHYIRKYREPKIIICYRIIEVAKEFGIKITLEDLRPFKK